MTKPTTKTYTYHQPVMLPQVIEALDIKRAGTYVDLTFGGGGHAQAILDKLDKQGTLWAFDQDPDARLEAQKIDDDRLYFVEGNFRFFADFLQAYDVTQVDGILADLGVSSHQFDLAERGFAVRLDGPLDMRMHQQGELTAAKMINGYNAKQLTHIFVQYGDIKRAKPLVIAILEARQKQPITTIVQFKQIVSQVAPRGKEYKYYAKVFQALRIAVNNEQDALHNMLYQVPKMLRRGGRFVAITYHSGEDRPIKNFIKTGNIAGKIKQDIYGNILRPLAPIYDKRGVCPSPQEIAKNNRARSARMRVAISFHSAKASFPSS